jgi:hypothetical protein
MIFPANLAGRLTTRRRPWLPKAAASASGVSVGLRADGRDNNSLRLNVRAAK